MFACAIQTFMFLYLISYVHVYVWKYKHNQSVRALHKNLFSMLVLKLFQVRYSWKKHVHNMHHIKMDLISI